MSTTESVNLTDLELFSQGAPWDAFAKLRRDDPVAWCPEDAPNSGFWSITRHADVVAVNRDEATFSAERGAVNLEELDVTQLKIRKSMLETDGARHWALRRLLQSSFSHSSLAGYETFLRGLTATTLDNALPKGSFDLVDEISAEFPIRVLARMLGVPDERTGELIEWGNRMVGNTDPEMADVLLSSAASDEFKHLPFRSPAAVEVFAYGDELATQRRGGDGDDLVSRLVNGVLDDGIALSARDFRNYFLLLVVAGNETTRHAISHSVKALIDDPAALGLLQERPDLIPQAVEEFLRWASPIYHFRRTAARDVEVHGRNIREGDKVVMWFASGNRDEEVFGNPDVFDVTRTPNDHLAFGKGGPHFCLGNALARMELRIMFESLLPRISSIRKTGDVEYVQSNFVRGIKRFPVEIVTC